MTARETRGKDVSVSNGRILTVGNVWEGHGSQERAKRGWRGSEGGTVVIITFKKSSVVHESLPLLWRLGFS